MHPAGPGGQIEPRKQVCHLLRAARTELSRWGKLRHRTGVCERGCPRARALKQFQGWKARAPSQVRALSGDRSHPSRVLLGGGPRHLFSPGRGPGKADRQAGPGQGQKQVMARGGNCRGIRVGLRLT